MNVHNCQNCKIKSVAETFLTEAEFGKLEENSAIADFKKGDLIIKQNALSLNVVYLHKGMVKIHVTGPAKEKIIKLVKAPSYLGIPTTLGDKTNQYSVTAITDTTVCFIDTNFFRLLITDNGQFAYEIILDMCRNELFDQQRFVNQEQKQLPGRIAEGILCMSERLFNGNKFEIPVSRNDMADMIGTSRESLSRTLNTFIKDNIIKLDGNSLEIVNKEKLQIISKNG
jgi:CRP/FNR family transcriptional regulator